jgi:hypothetical protein
MEKKPGPRRQKSTGNLVRQTVLIPEDLKHLVVRESYAYGVSQNELISRAIRAYLAGEEPGPGDEPDGEFASVVGMFGKGLPRDLAAEHDRHLYHKEDH